MPWIILVRVSSPMLPPRSVAIYHVAGFTTSIIQHKTFLQQVATIFSYFELGELILDVDHQFFQLHEASTTSCTMRE
eukprot:scaffold168_cov124-Cylindrotheca_fusiformis.AAC.6